MGSLYFLPLSAFSAVILQYHHVSSETPAITSISPQGFAEHMAFLQDNGFNVVPLPQLMEKIRKKQAIDDKTVAITFDDGYDSVYHNARPILKKLGWPYTIFVNPKFIDGKYSRHISWQQLNEMAKENVTIANHTMAHDYMVRPPKGTPVGTWREKMLAEVEQAELRIKQMTGQNHKMLAYPYGEFDQELQIAMKQHGYTAFGQHSGAVGHYTNLTRIPRFPASGIYANLNTLKDKLYSLPFKIEGLQNANMVIEQNPATLKVWLKADDFNPSQLNCFAQGATHATIKWHNKNSQFSVVSPEPLPEGRSRYNCTAPSKSKPGRFYWFSQPWLNLQAQSKQD